MTDFNEIKYKLDRISNLLDGFILDWKTQQNALNVRFGNLQKMNDRERTPLIAVCGGAIPILLAMFSLGRIDITELTNYLIVDFIFALGIFFFYAIYNYSNTRIHANIEADIVDSIDNLGAVKTHLNKTSYDIKQFNNKNLDALYAISKLTQGDARIRFHRILESSIKKRLLHTETKQQFKSILESSKNIVEDSIQDYNIAKEHIESPEWKEFSFLYENLAKESKKLTR